MHRSRVRRLDIRIIRVLQEKGRDQDRKDLQKNDHSKYLTQNEKNMSRSFHIATMGCQMNEYDSDQVGQILLNSGYFSTDKPEDADLIIINTCSVRAKAEQKAFSFLGRMSKLKKKKPELILGVMGCIAQQENLHLFKRFPDLNMVIGTREIHKVQEMVERIERYGEEKVSAIEFDTTPPPMVNVEGHFKNKTKSYISIMVGCNNFCSYCIVPYVRGREQSRSLDELVLEAENLISQGVKEITFLGQNVNSYYWEKENIDFPAFLRKMNSLDGLTRIRFTSSHPKDLSDDLIRCFGELEHLCPHIHLPFQAGSNRILKLMNRNYTREKYTGLIKKLREVRPDIAITSDVMVGFPSETEEDFQLTLDLIRKIEFDNLFSFKYSDRKGTRAEEMDRKISEDEKSFRLYALQELQKEITLKKNTELEGQILEILVEGISRMGGQYSGRTKTNKIVNFVNKTNKVGDILNVLIKRSSMNSLQGEYVEVI